MYETKQHQFKWPIDGVFVANFKLLSVEAYKSVEDNETEKTLMRALIAKSTDISIKQIKKLATPDYNSLKEIMTDIISKSANVYFKEAGKDFDPDNPPLLQPITGDDGKEISSYKIKPPTVDTTDIMETIDDEWERTMMVSSTCTGLTPLELNRLSYPDWLHLQERLINFLGETSEFFRETT